MTFRFLSVALALALALATDAQAGPRRRAQPTYQPVSQPVYTSPSQAYPALPGAAPEGQRERQVDEDSAS